MAIRFANPILQTLAMTLIDNHGGDKNLLMIGSGPGHMNLMDLPSPEYLAMQQNRIPQLRKELATMESLVAFYEVVKAFPGNNEVFEVID